MHPELLRVGDPVAVKDRVVAVVLMVFVRVKRVLVGAGLIHEADTFRRHLKPRLRPHPEHLRGPFLQRFDAGLFVGLQRGPVKHHRGVRLIHLGTHPEAGADTVAAGSRHRARVGDDPEIPGCSA